MSINLKTKLILSAIFVALAGVAIYSFFFQEKSLTYDSVLVERGDISQTVRATGQVTSVKEMDLGFEIQGRIESIAVSVGEKTELGELLAELESRDLEIQVLEAKANRDVAKASLEQVLAGASKEEIRMYETAVENAESALQEAKTSLKNKQQSLSDTMASTQDDLEAVYEDALNVLEDSYLKIFNAFITADSIQRTYFSSSDQEGIKVKENKVIIENVKNEISSSLKAAKDNFTNENIDKALAETKDGLGEVYDALSIIRETCEAITYRSDVSSTDKTSLDNQKSYINTALVNTANAQQLISSTKLTNESSINTAKAQVESANEAVKVAEGNLKSAQDKLEQIKSLPRGEEIALASAKLEQAEASLLKAQQQLSKVRLTSPCEGAITDILKHAGETINTTEAVVSMICEGRLQVEVDIAETDIGKVSVGDKAEIVLDAFPGEFFPGLVLKINPAETIVQGVVYYKATLSLEEAGEKIKPGMTTETVITTDFRENVLIIPQRAIFEKDNKKFVKVVSGKEIKEVEVKTGIRDETAKIEIISGLEEGDEVITFISRE